MKNSNEDHSQSDDDIFSNDSPRENNALLRHEKPQHAAITMPSPPNQVVKIRYPQGPIKSERSFGEFQNADIISAIRSFLKDNDLIHFNQLSRAFYYRFDNGRYLPCPATPDTIIDQLSPNRCINIVNSVSRYDDMVVTYTYDEGRERKTYERRIIACRPNGFIEKAMSHFFYFYIEVEPWHREGYRMSIALREVADISRLLIRWRHEYWENNPHNVFQLSQTQKVSLSTYTYRIPSDVAQLLEKIHVGKKWFPKFYPAGLFNCALVSLVWLINAGLALLFLAISLAPTTPFMLYIADRNRGDQENQFHCQQRRLQFLANHSYDADIHMKQPDLLINNTELAVIPCLAALNNLTVSQFGNFAQVMQLLGLSNFTNTTLLTCLLWMQNCTMGSSFDTSNTVINDQISVGCQQHDFTQSCDSRFDIAEWGLLTFLVCLLSLCITKLFLKSICSWIKAECPRTSDCAKTINEMIKSAFISVYQHAATKEFLKEKTAAGELHDSRTVAKKLEFVGVFCKKINEERNNAAKAITQNDAIAATREIG